MRGLDGNDTYYVDASWDIVLEADGGGTDIVYTSTSFSLANQFAEHLIMMGEDPMRGVGNQLNNLIVGNTANNIIHGGAGDDTLTGGDGIDILTGGAGRDDISGDAGIDIFVFMDLTDSRPEDGATDRIFGFARGQDRIDLRLIDASATLANDQAFVLDANGSFSEGEIRQTLQGPDLLLEFNADGDAAIEMAILLTSQVAPLTETDFIL
jgi:Ca2+-binding RTX toxin-like protein